MTELFKGSDHSADYAKYRPTTPQIVVDRILSYLKEKHGGPFRQALDVGCGTGQSTRVLTPYFEKVTGVDVSDTQIEQANLTPENPENVEFAVSSAEALPLGDNSTQLVTASTAFHWFDKDRFIESAKRILDTNGVLATYCVQPLSLKGRNEQETEELREAVVRFHEVDTVKYRDERGSLDKQAYIGYALPMRDSVRDEDLVTYLESTFENYMSYIKTWSSYRKLIRAEGNDAGEKALKKFEGDLLKALNAKPADRNVLKVTIVLKYVLLMGRK